MARKKSKSDQVKAVKIISPDQHIRDAITDPAEGKKKKRKKQKRSDSPKSGKSKSGLFTRYFGPKVGKARVYPVSLKIVLLFTLFLFVSNLLTNYISYLLYKDIHTTQLNNQMVNDLNTIYNSSDSYYRQYRADPDANYERAKEQLRQTGYKLLEKHATRSNPRNRAFIAGVLNDGTFLFYSSRSKLEKITDDAALETMNHARSECKAESGSSLFHIGSYRYKAVYQWSSSWDAYIVVAEELNEFNRGFWNILALISGIILGISLIFIFVGNASLRYILRYIRHITDGIMKMQSSGKLTTIDMKKAPADDVSYLGISLNALIVMVDNLMMIFRRFATTDVVKKAYKELDVKLEGEQKELTMLFTDIRSFTYRTETLGADIIRLLNMHYDKAIERIHHNNGIIGSIIGDALLAVYGTEGQQESESDSRDNKSWQALRSAYEIQKVAAHLRELMTLRREELQGRHTELTKEEETLYNAVMIEVGVGLDKGNVFYGNIGSTRRMTNTVIGDRVNSASRLEGLTRFYDVPVIISPEVKEEVEAVTDQYRFLELDRVQVKGKSNWVKIYWPVPIEEADDAFEKEAAIFDDALNAYYEGDWIKARRLFKKCKLNCSEFFSKRLKGEKVPPDWNGVWAMDTK